MTQPAFPRHVVLKAAAVCAMLVLSACSSNLFGGPGIEVTRTSDQAGAPVIANGVDPEEEVIARREHPKILANYGGQFNNRKAEIVVAQIVSKLLTAADQPNAKFTITILDTPDINAFALPGRYIYVTRGILALANDSSELAAVIAHEISHVILRHASERITRARTSELVDRVITSVFGGDAATDQTAARSKLSLAKFSQEQELAADKEGILIAGKAGFDPHAAARFLGAMGHFASAMGEDEESADDFLSSHPSTPNRIEQAIATARQFGAPGLGVTDRDRYLAAIDGLTFGDNPDHGAIVGQRFVHPLLKFVFEVPAAYTLQNTKNAVVGTAANGSALRFDSAEVPADMGLVDYLRSGWIAGLTEGSVSTRRSGDIEIASAEAKTEQWVFRINVARLDDVVYRFIFAAKEDSDNFAAASTATANSFRRTRPDDVRPIKHTLVRLITAAPGDTTASISEKMQGVTKPLELFLALNNLYDGDQIVPGTQYKIIAVE